MRYFDVDWDVSTTQVDTAPTDLEYDLETDSGALAVGTFIIRPQEAHASDQYAVELLPGAMISSTA